MINTRGFSNCRLCNRANGSITFEYENWTWPSGYTHYIREHNVRPSDAFYEFVKKAGRQMVTGTDIILEVEQICGDYRICVRRDGTVSITKVKDSETIKPFTEQPMPSEKFWLSLGSLIKSMADEISKAKEETNAVAVRNKSLYDHIVGQDKIIEGYQEKKRKFIPVGASRKEMFAAGVVFGKNMK